MFLFLTIPIICLLMAFSSDIVKLLHISYLLTVMLKEDESSLQQQLVKAREELERVRKTPAVSGEYAHMVKTMRAEQKLKDIEETMRNKRNMGRIKGASAELVVSYGVKAILSLLLIIISIRNRYTPVMVFDDRFNFKPLEGLLSFPTGIHNAISVPVWVLSCNVTFRLISNLIKRKK